MRGAVSLQPVNLASQLAGHGVASGVYQQSVDGAVTVAGPADRDRTTSSRRFYFCSACGSLGVPDDYAAHQLSSGHVDAVTQRCRASLSRFVLAFPLEALPLEVLHRVLSCLPVDQRLRLTELSRAWRALLADTSFWLRLDLSSSSGCARFTVQLFHAAVAKADGQLRVLDLTGRILTSYGEWTTQAVCNEVAENAPCLTELRAPGISFDERQLTAMVVPASRLTHFACEAMLESVYTSLVVLRNQPPFASLRLTRLDVHQTQIGGGWRDASDVPVFASAVAGHTSLQHLQLYRAFHLNSAVAMGALVDAVISLRLSSLSLMYCGCTPATVPALTRLVAHGSLHKLEISNFEVNLFEDDDDDDDTRLFCEAARKSCDDAVLNTLMLYEVGENEDAVEVVRYVMGPDDEDEEDQGYGSGEEFW